MTWECKFIDRNINKVIYRNYKWKQLNEIEAMARKNNWLLIKWAKYE